MRIDRAKHLFRERPDISPTLTVRERSNPAAYDRERLVAVRSHAGLHCPRRRCVQRHHLLRPSRGGLAGLGFYLRSNIEAVTTVHHGHMPEIDVTSETTATGVWAMEDIVETPGDILHGYGHYWETYRKVDGKWLIETLHLTRTRVTQSYKARQAPLT